MTSLARSLRMPSSHAGDQPHHRSLAMPSSHAGDCCIVTYNIGVGAHDWCESKDPKRQEANKKKWTALTNDTRGLLRDKAGERTSRTPNVIIFQEVGPSNTVNEKAWARNSTTLAPPHEPRQD